MKSKKEKFRKALLDLADSGKFIPGIYNYCDRWCERCSFKDKCLTYAHEQDIRKECNNPETNFIDDEKLWEQICLSFELTLDMISEDAKSFGINLDDFRGVEEPEKFQSDAEILSRNYSQNIYNWLCDNNDKFNANISHLLTVHDKKATAVKFADALEVVQWYCFNIPAKVHRSYFNLKSRQKDDDSKYNKISDNKGSAKVTIIGINRSIEALTFLYTELNEQEDEILNFLNQLSELKKQMLATFPTAMEFKRPGFDD